MCILYNDSSARCFLKKGSLVKKLGNGIFCLLESQSPKALGCTLKNQRTLIIFVWPSHAMACVQTPANVIWCRITAGAPVPVLWVLGRCERNMLGQSTAGCIAGLYCCKGLCHPTALLLYDVSMRTVFNEEKWAQTSSNLNLDTSHLDACWKFQFPGIWRLEEPLGNWVSAHLLLIRGEGASDPMGSWSCSCWES